jgi:hypothetical protein
VTEALPERRPSPTPPAWGDAIRRRRLLAARVARLLSSRVSGRDTWVSSEAGVVVGEGVGRPLCVVCRGALPVDGLVRTSPLLVVEDEAGGDPGDPGGSSGPSGLGDPGAYLDAGAVVVWQLHGAGVVVHRAGRQPRLRVGGQRLSVPGHPGLSIAVATFLDELQVSMSGRGSWNGWEPSSSM